MSVCVWGGCTRLWWRCFRFDEAPLPPEGIQTCATLTIAAQDLRVYRGNQTFDVDLTKHKLRTCLHMAAAHGYWAVVLGAIGCGAFKNPPNKIANAFKELIEKSFALVLIWLCFQLCFQLFF